MTSDNSDNSRWRDLDLHEKETENQLADEMTDYDDLARKVYDALVYAADCFSGLAVQPPVAKLQTWLLARLMADLRVCHWAAVHGYVVQALSLASVVHEVSYGLIYLGNSNDKAKEWVEHDNLKRTYPECGHREVIKHVKPYFPGLTQEHMDSEYGVYQQLCLAKHGNPLVQKQYGAIDDAGTVTIQHPPFHSERTVFFGRYALLHACRAACTALTVYVRLHLAGADDQEFVELLKEFGNSFRELSKRDGLVGEAP